MKAEDMNTPIIEKDGVFRLQTKDTSYIMCVNEFKHIEHIYYGKRISESQSIEPLRIKHAIPLGSVVAYKEEDVSYTPDVLAYEWGNSGKSDFKHPSIECKMPDGTFVTDFTYKGYEVIDGIVEAVGLPSPYVVDTEKTKKDDKYLDERLAKLDLKFSKVSCDCCDEICGACDCPDSCKSECTKGSVKTLAIELADEKNDISLTLYYVVFYNENVIARRCVLKNGEDNSLTLKKLDSMTVDIPNKNYKMITFDGDWIREAHRHDRKLQYGITTINSNVGSSSNRHNAGFLIAEEKTDETSGEAYGFNLMYSSNHNSTVEMSNYDLLRISQGIDPYHFEWKLEKGEKFETPFSVFTYSDSGFNKLSGNFHDFINNHVISSAWRLRERPILINSWESFTFNFTEKDIVNLAKVGKEHGVEMVVLDDGWFGDRNNDLAGLGDYDVIKEKLPNGMAGLSKKVHDMGMMFGLWFEPEMVNPDSKLYRSHPEYAVAIEGREPSLGRHQMLLDLTNPEVRDYIVENVTKIIDEADIDYIKWDFNRHITDDFSNYLAANNISQGEFHHRYILGFYEVINRIFGARPHILYESCASGGDRFDLGILRYSPQAWASDNTDPIVRLSVQKGLSYLYPVSTMGSHVTATPNAQTLRRPPLTTRFNVSAFGAFGYELDLSTMTKPELVEVKKQTEFYKKCRKLFQFGTFRRLNVFDDNKFGCSVIDRDKKHGIVGFYQVLENPSESADQLQIPGFDEDKEYVFRTKPQPIFLESIGHLAKNLPLVLSKEEVDWIKENEIIPDAVETYELYGSTLASGQLKLTNKYSGTSVSSKVRLMTDFGSNLYIVDEK